MNTLAVAVGALGTGIPDGTANPLLTVGLATADIVAGLGAFVVATLAVVVVRHFQAAGDGSPNRTASPDRGHELKRAA